MSRTDNGTAGRRAADARRGPGHRGLTENLGPAENHDSAVNHGLTGSHGLGDGQGIWSSAGRVGAPSGSVRVAARGLTISLGGRPVVRDVDLAVAAGEVLALVGPNGAGKSTLLAALAGDLRPDSGAVTLDGRDIGGFPARQLARLRAVHLQHHTVAFAFTVREVVAMGRAPWPAAPDDEARLAAALACADVTHLAERLVPTLSGGERARVALARTFAQDTGILLLDEPTAALDLGHQEQIAAEIAHRAAAGCAVVVVLHDLRLAAAYADRVALLVDGAIVANGRPEAVMRDEELSRAYRYPVRVHRVDGELQIVPRRATGVRRRLAHDVLPDPASPDSGAIR